MIKSAVLAMGLLALAGMATAQTNYQVGRSP